MKNFKKNHKRGRFRSNGDRNFLRNNGQKKLITDFTNITDFKRKNPGRNGQNASKLIDKYTVLAREALSNGDKILSENYLQHADHFMRIIEDKNKNNKDLISLNILGWARPIPYADKTPAIGGIKITSIPSKSATMHACWLAAPPKHVSTYLVTSYPL